MIRVFIIFLIGVVIVGMFASDPKDGSIALLTVAILSAVALFFFRRHTDEKDFVTYAFLGALCVRLIFGILVHIYDLRGFAGPDSIGYDVIGSKIVDFWTGIGNPLDADLKDIMSLRGPGWGMNYLVAIIYLIAGKSIFVAQSFCACVGAATVPMVYFCSEQVFHNKRVAKVAALAVAFFPAMIIWSSQLLKDGLIVFLLVLAITMVLQIQKKFSLTGLLFLILALSGILSLRFYIFYMVVLAVIGSFVIGLSTSIRAIIQRSAILLVMAAAMTYLGVIRIASGDLQAYGSLERVQYSRNDLAHSDSGYGSEQDVSTVAGAISAVPLGFAVLLFAPFPWEMRNLRQSLTLPEVLLWWSLIPLLVYGLWYTIRNRLRESLPILIFTALLTLSYSVFQGNLGAAYRQRTQIQVFFFMFIAVGWGLIRERMEDKKAIETNRKREMAMRLRAQLQQTRQIQ